MTYCTSAVDLHIFINIYVFHFLSITWTYFDIWKTTKWRRNMEDFRNSLSPYTSFLSGKQGLGMNLSQPALKCKQSIHVEPAPVDVITHIFTDDIYHLSLICCTFGEWSIKLHNKYNTAFVEYFELIWVKVVIRPADSWQLSFKSTSGIASDRYPPHALLSIYVGLI